MLALPHPLMQYVCVIATHIFINSLTKFLDGSRKIVQNVHCILWTDFAFCGRGQFACVSVVGMVLSAEKEPGRYRDLDA